VTYSAFWCAKNGLEMCVCLDHNVNLMLDGGHFSGAPLPFRSIYGGVATPHPHHYTPVNLMRTESTAIFVSIDFHLSFLFMNSFSLH